MRYGSLCSGIEAATVAWHPLGWQPAFFSEIEKFPSAVLAHHYAEVPNLGDITKFRSWPDYDVDVLVGGTPCQSFSVAGLRKGLADPRGNLALTYLAIADRYRPEWLVWENVPGVLSSGEGRDFGAFLGGLAELGYGFTYRVLDAQYVRVDGFGRAVPQGRRRVFVVGNSRDWRRAAAVLLEPESLSWHPAPRREAGERAAPTISARPTGGGGLGTDFDLDGGLISSTGSVPHCLNAGGMGRIDYETETMIAHTLLGKENDSHAADLDTYVSFAIQAGATRENPDSGPDGVGIQSGHAYTIEARPEAQAVAFTCSEMANSFAWERDVYPTLDAQIPNDSSNIQKGIRQGWAVRRLTPRECERLQGFPDGYSNIPWRGQPEAPDGPRYKALGNSMAVNVMRWIGTRIQMVQDICDEGI